MSADEISAAKRDASWHDHPGKAWKYHVIVTRTASGGPGSAACSPERPGRWTRMTLVDFTERLATEVPVGMRCQRPGCRQAWPAETT